MEGKKYTLSNFLSYLEYVGIVLSHWNSYSDVTKMIVMPSYMLQTFHNDIINDYIINSDDQGFHLPDHVLKCKSFSELKVVYDEIIRDLKTHDLSMIFDYNTQSGVSLRVAENYIKLIK